LKIQANKLPPKNVFFVCIQIKRKSTFLNSIEHISLVETNISISTEKLKGLENFLGSKMLPNSSNLNKRLETG